MCSSPEASTRTDLYLTVGPEPFGPDEELPHSVREARAPEDLLGRVLTRDGSKTLAADAPDLPDVRRLSTRALRAERDRLARLRAQSPPDRSQELRLATMRAAEAEQARQQARSNQQAACEQVAALTGSWLRRRELAAAKERLAVANYALGTRTGQADQTAERLGLLRREQQRHRAWFEAHDAELRIRERAVAREVAWRRRVDQHTLALDPPSWLVAELGPVPTDPQERTVWRAAAAELDSYRRAYGLDHDRPAKHVGGRVARDGRAAAPATGPTAAERAGGTRAQRERRRHREQARRSPGSARAAMAPEGRHRVDAGRLLGAEPRRGEPGRRRDWQTVWAALERLADHHRRGRDDRDRPQERAGRLHARDLGRQERDGR